MEIHEQISELYPFPAPSDALEVIVKVAGETCNINCHYCFERRKPYERADILAPDALRDFLDRMNGRPLSIGLHGGEPLIIGQDRMAALLEEIRRYPAPVSLKLQTNGILLDRSWLALFDEFAPTLQLGISLDGDPQANRHRVDFKDQPTHARVEAALDLLSELDRTVGVISVVTRLALGRERELLEHFLHFHCIRSLNLVPCLDFRVRAKRRNRGNLRSLELFNPEGQDVPGWATTPLEYADSLKRSFDAWRETQAYRRFAISPFVSIIRLLAGRGAETCHFTPEKCAHVLTLYPDGRVGSCDELSMPQSLLASADERIDSIRLTRPETNLPLHRELSSVLGKCRSCEYESTCGGGCVATRVRYLGTDYYEEYCDYRKAVIDHVRRSIDGLRSRNPLQ